MRAEEEVSPGAEVPGATNTSHRQAADSTNDSNGGQVGDGALDDLIDYLAACCGDSTRGWLHVGVGHRPHLNDRGKYDHERFEPKPFRWPDEAQKAVEFILAESQQADVWLCPSPMLHDWTVEDGKKKTGRRKGEAVSLFTVHADIDGQLDIEKVKSIEGAFAVASGSPGHAHVYVWLSEPITSAQHDALSKGLGAHLGNADVAKHSDNDLLRPPGTFNHKSAAAGGEPTRVTWSVKPVKTMDPRRLAEMLGVDLDAPEEKAKTNGKARATSHHQPEDPKPLELEKFPKVGEANGQQLHDGEPINLALDPKVRTALETRRVRLDGTGDRSVDAYRVLCACVDVGLTEAQAEGVLRRRGDLADWLDENPAGELERTWEKITERREDEKQEGEHRHLRGRKQEDPQPFELEEYPKVAEALEVVCEPPDRSRDIHGVVRAVYEAGLTETHAMSAVQQRADLADRLDEHPEDVARSWAKIDNEQRLAYTDTGNATALVAEYSASIRYVPEIGKWIHWNGVCWRIDPDTGQIDTASRQIASNLPGSSQREVRHRQRSLSASGINSMVRLARSDPAMRVSRDRLDANARQLNTPTGIVDLGTGEIDDHRREAWHTRITGAGYDPNGDCPRWSMFLDTIFEGDKELILYVQGLFGYAAIGEVLSNILPFFWGAGNNGKSVLLEVVKSVLGDYAIPAPANFLLAGRDRHETEIARLAGARFVVCSEINPGTRFDEAKVKLLTGGDTLTGRFMHGNFFDFRPSHTLFLVGNHQPKVGAGGHAFWRRVRLVPFTHQVPEDHRIEGLAAQLIRAEGPAILGWIVAGAITASAGGLVTPERVLSATEEYEESEDRIKQFLDDCTSRGTRDDRETIGDVYQRYIEWCQANRIRDPLENTVFAREIYARAGLEKARSGDKRYVRGLRLHSRASDREYE